jgi:hypothetical protein
MFVTNYKTMVTMPQQYPEINDLINVLVNWALTILIIVVIGFSFYVDGYKKGSNEKRIKRKLIRMWKKLSIEDLEHEQTIIKN